MIETLLSDKEYRFSEAMDILYLAKQDGIEIFLKENQLQLKIPEKQEINQKLLGRIKENKQLIIDFLGDNNWKSKNVAESYNKVNKSERKTLTRLPLSFSQERLWFIDQLEGSIQYHSADVLRLKGKVDTDALQHALETIVYRHEVLRTVVREDETGPFQYIKENSTFQLSIVTAHEFSNKDSRLSSLINDLINEPFNLSQDNMLRVNLITITPDEHVLVIVLHHIASDGWSKSIFFNELTELYKAYTEKRTAQLKTLDIQFADFAIWQRQYLQGDVLDKKIEYWKKKLDGVGALQLQTDYPRPILQTSKGTSTDILIDWGLSRQLKLLSQKQGVTLFITLLSAFKVLLYRYSNQEDICVGTSIADRPQREVEELIGFFVNTLALRSVINGNSSFIELLQEVKRTTLEAYEHQDLPFEKVVEVVVKDRDTSRHPLFQVMLVLSNNAEVPEMQLGEVVVYPQAIIHNASKFDFTFFFLETPTGLQLTVAYNTDLFRLPTIKRMIGHFDQLLASIVSQPEQRVGKLRMLAVEEETQLLEQLNTSKLDYPKSKNVVELFEEQVVRSPDSIAIVFERDQLSYSQLNRKANQLANFLISKGIREEALVPVCIERSLEMMIGILGILKAGAAYVPIDPEYPIERISYMLQDTNAGLVVTDKENRSKLRDLENVELVELNMNTSEAFGMPEENVYVDLKPGHLAYVIYTSGSTGRPKGVMIEHRNLVDYVFGLQQKTQIDQCASFALVSSISTDLGNTVLYSSLIFGGALHLFSKETINDGYLLKRYFIEQDINCLKIVPSHWKALSGNIDLILPTKLLIFGGEALQTDLVEKIKLSGADCTVVNHYGPTETTIGKLLHIVDLQNKYDINIPIGKPFSNTYVYVLSKQLALCPVGVPGELFIGGDGIGRGYVNNEDLTQSQFIQNPFKETQSSLLYRTGDLVRYNSEGDIEFLGRIDEQVKIRGFRIELGEIESLLEQSELVTQAVVLAKDNNHGNKILVGYVVADDFFERSKVISYLEDRLPDYMIPTLWIELERFPLIANGKIDRKALPSPDTFDGTVEQYETPRNELEGKLVEIWQDLLEVEQVGIHDNFFELGGHSLLAIQLISTIRKQLQVEVSIGDIFDYSTVALLAEQFETQLSTTVLPAIKIQSRPERIPLSFNQERLWFIHQTEGSVQYHRPDVLRLKGALNNEALRFALQTIINRHEVLRTVILEHDGEPYQFIKDKDEWKLTFVDGSQFKNDQKGLQENIDRLIEEPFDLSKDGMIRAHLIELDQLEHLLVITMHHIASDGWSFSIFIKEFGEIYNCYVKSRPLQLNQLPIQYVDFSIWQRQYLQGELLDNKLSYWKNKLAGLAPLQLPTDYTRPAVLSSKGAMTTFEIDSKLSNNLQQLSQEQGATLFMTMLAAFKVLLFRYSGHADICIGCPIAGRQQKEVEGLIGFFVNTLAIRSEVTSDANFIELLQQVRGTTLEAFEQQEVPFEKVVNAVVKERDMSRSPLFQVMFDLGTHQNSNKLSLGQLEVVPEPFEFKTSKFDLTLSIAKVDVGLKGFMTYSTDLYSEETILRMVTHFKNLLAAIAENPKQKIGTAAMLTGAEEQQLIVEFNNTSAAYPNDKTVVELFEDQVVKTPNNIAVVAVEDELSYQKLNERANRLAHYLHNKGVREETLVPIFIGQSVEMIVGILAILKAGGAYVPIDPEYPLARIKYMVGDTGASIILSTREKSRKLEISEDIEVVDILADFEIGGKETFGNVEAKAKSNNLAYVIYTSGSTGMPKGVMIEHRSLVNYLVNSKTKYIDDEESKSGSLMHLSYTFDASLTSIFMPLLSGKSIVIASGEEANVFERNVVSKKAPYNFIKATPSHLTLLESNITYNYNRLLTKRLVIGGEPLFLSHFNYFWEMGLDLEIVNEYGPTEATVGCSTYSFRTVTDKEKIGDKILIGKPIDNVQLYVKDSNNEILPIGVFGEICIGGDGLARGYLNQPELTAEKFIMHRLKGKNVRIYKTGDVGRWLPDGNLEYLGRKDEQVKIRGFRIELGEVESVLQQCELVSQGVVIAKEDSNSSKHLTAYVVPVGSFNSNGILSYLQGKLPEYMVPGQLIELDSLPVTPNGKIDRKALMLLHGVGGTRNQYVAARNDLEVNLVVIWQDLLKLEQVSINDNFFQLGGHSLLAMQMISRIRQKLDIELTFRDLFQFNTVSKLSKYIELHKMSHSDEKDSLEFELFSI